MLPRALGEEWGVLAPDFDEYERRHGVCPAVLAVSGAAAPAFVVRYPRLPAERLPKGAYLYRAPEHFTRPKLAAHLAALGFFVDDDRVVRTVPTPRSFARLIEAMGLGDRGYRAALIRTVSASMPTGQWLDHVVAGTFPINVGAPLFYGLSRLAERTPLRRISGLSIEIADVGILAHDMGVHALAAHLLPGGDVREIGDRIRARVREAGVRARDHRALEPIGSFFEEDLTLHCQTLWRRAASVAEFDAAYAASRRELFERLERRLGELNKEAGRS